MKICNRCFIEKELGSFNKAKTCKDGHRNCCKVCQGKVKTKWRQNNKVQYNKKSKEWNKKNPEKLKETMRKWRKENPEKARTGLLKFKYGINIEIYKEMFAAQKGYCAICGIHQNDHKRGFCVDHNHETNKVRELLCDSCNKGLGFFKDNEELIEKALIYLKYHKEKK